MAEDNDKKIMRGEFRGDFTRDTFDPMKAFSRVLMQQGRVQVDADWNEQVSILLHYMRSFNRDMGGPHWGPADEEKAGFLIGIDTDKTLTISSGHYYVNGILCECGADEIVSYNPEPENGSYLVYLDVWERHITHVEDDAIREVALGGADTASRSQVVWQVKIIEGNSSSIESYAAFISYIQSKGIIRPGTGMMSAEVKSKSDNDVDPCLTAPDSRYRGAENQLYRVEIHNPGKIGTATATDAATFKWSRENASVIFPIIEIVDNSISLEHLGRDCRYGLKPNDWVEIVDDDYILQNRAESLMQIESVDNENRQVILKPKTGNLHLSTVNIEDNNLSKSPYLRRWDHSNGDGDGVLINKDDLDLEDGIQIKFTNADAAQIGDYWLIPARTVTGDIEWPQDVSILPHGVIHHYAPLAIINNGNLTDLRRILQKQWK